MSKGRPATHTHTHTGLAYLPLHAPPCLPAGYFRHCARRRWQGPGLGLDGTLCAWSRLTSVVLSLGLGWQGVFGCHIAPGGGGGGSRNSSSRWFVHA